MNFMVVMTKPSLNPALKSFWQTKADTKVLKGGRASSKTWDAAGFAVFLAANYSVKFLCVRQFQNKIQESVYAILVIQIERFGLTKEFDILKTVIRHRATGSEFHFYGIHRNIAEIKGFEGANICWIEEGEGLTKKQWEVIEPTIRSEGAECWILYNPRLVSDFVEQFKHDPDNGIIVRQINYQENPYLSSTMVRKIQRLKESSEDDYNHIYGGQPKSDDDDVVIKRSWINAAIDAHLVLDIGIGGESQLGFDVADSGKDLNAQYHRVGITCLWGESWKGLEDELKQSSNRVYSKAIQLGAAINYDSIGVGAGCGSEFKSINKESGRNIKYHKFVAGGAVTNPDQIYLDAGDESITNKDFFENLKAQSWWKVADRFRNTYNAVTKGMKFDENELISISSKINNLPNLITELSTPKRKFSKAGKVMVESKDDLAKREVASPNDADAFIMAYADKKDSGPNQNHGIRMAL